MSPCRGAWARLAAGLVIALASSRAAAAETDAPANPPIAGDAVVPPKLIEQPAVPYPEHASGDALVVVTLVVASDGSVRTAEAASGEQPFADAAVDGVKRWHFEPATRGGTKVSARIRIEVAFRAPVVPPASPAPAEELGATPQKPASEDEAIEVTVVGEQRRPATAVTLATTEVRQIPGTFGDPFRVVDVLPGVVPFTSGLPYFYVRGAPPGNVGYYIDGIRVPYLYHVGFGPSVVHPGMIESVDLYTGGYPPRYGRFAGGVVAGQVKPPNTTLHGEASIRLLDAGALVEGGFADGRGTLLFGGRYSYTGALLSLLTKQAMLDYRDYQMRASYDLGERDQISLLAFGAYDVAGRKAGDLTSIDFGAEFYRAELRWDHRIGDTGRLRTAALVGYDQTVIGPAVRAQDRIGGVHMELHLPIRERLRLHAGADGQLDSYRTKTAPFEDPDTPVTKRISTLFPGRRDTVVGAYAELGVEIVDGFTISPGVRVDRYSSGGVDKFGVDPRISSKQRVTKTFALVEAAGVAHQLPSFALPLPGLNPSGVDQGLQTAYQSSAGVEWNAARRTLVKGGLFYNVYDNLSDSLGVPEGLTTDLKTRTKGSAYGLEAFFYRSMTERLGGFVSYTLSWSRRRLNRVNFPAMFDRRHVISAAASYDLGRRWRLGARVSSYTGGPKASPSATSGAVSDGPVTQSDPNRRYEDPQREPIFVRVDARIEKLWRVGQRGHVSFITEVLNISGSQQNIDGRSVPVVVPNIGVEGGF
ncbi:MAG TPA: TonB-dependent receptor [Polyangiaceae bacterium]|nr:TonB-dependent receptor [Polyangiaceae bacterium]